MDELREMLRAEYDKMIEEKNTPDEPAHKQKGKVKDEDESN